LRCSYGAEKILKVGSLYLAILRAGLVGFTREFISLLFVDDKSKKRCLSSDII
jgi:hypothetical protein